MDHGAGLQAEFQTNQASSGGPQRRPLTLTFQPLEWRRPIPDSGRSGIETGEFGPEWQESWGKATYGGEIIRPSLGTGEMLSAQIRPVAPDFA